MFDKNELYILDFSQQRHFLGDVHLWDDEVERNSFLSYTRSFGVLYIYVDTKYEEQKEVVDDQVEIVLCVR